MRHLRNLPIGDELGYIGGHQRLDEQALGSQGVRHALTVTSAQQHPQASGTRQGRVGRKDDAATGRTADVHNARSGEHRFMTSLSVTITRTAPRPAGLTDALLMGAAWVINAGVAEFVILRCSRGSSSSKPTIAR